MAAVRNENFTLPNMVGFIGSVLTAMAPSSLEPQAAFRSIVRPSAAAHVGRRMMTLFDGVLL